MPKVSVVIPCYKVEKYLDRCVESVVNQTLKDLEIILVDDGSPDCVPQMCDEWSLKDNRIKVIHKENGGLGMACNSGLDVATGDYIAFCDSDDYVDLNCYETLYKAAVSNKVDAVYSGIKRVTENGLVTPMRQAEKLQIFSADEVLNFQFGMIASEPSVIQERYWQMSAKVVLYSGETIRKYGVKFHSERQYISEDLLFNLDFLQHSHRVMELPKSFYYYFFNTSSLSQVLRKDRFEKYKLLRNYLLYRYPSIGHRDEFVRRVNKMFIGYVRSAMQQIVKSGETYREKRRLLTDICNDSIWNKLAQEYPINKMPKDKRLVFELTRHHWVSVLYLLFKFKR